MATIPQASVIGRISSLIEEINGVKSAAAKGYTKRATELGLSGDGTKDPGGYMGKSTHPSARAASNTHKTPLGSRAHENEADVKHDHPGAGVDNTDPHSGGSQDDKQYNIGTHQSATGEDPEVEDDYKGWKEDRREGDRGGTHHPADAEDIGEKYSSYRAKDLTKMAWSRMNELLADVANGVAYDANPAQAQPQSQYYNTPAASDSEKTAAAQAIIEQTILDAQINADLVGEFLTKYAENYTALLKSAAGEMGGEMEGEGPPPEGPPPEGDMGHGDDMFGGGGEGDMPSGHEGMTGEGAPEGHEGGGEGLDEMINALLQMGMTPEDIEQALQAHMHGGGGEHGEPDGDEGMGGGMPPDAGGAIPAGLGKAGSYYRRGLDDAQLVMLKAAGMAKQKLRSGNWNARPVTPGTKQAQERNEMQRYILEVCGLNR
jgi:hypothetical protein